MASLSAERRCARSFRADRRKMTAFVLGWFSKQLWSRTRCTRGFRADCLEKEGGAPGIFYVLYNIYISLFIRAERGVQGAVEPIGAKKASFLSAFWQKSGSRGSQTPLSPARIGFCSHFEGVRYFLGGVPGLLQNSSGDPPPRAKHHGRL